MIPGNTNLFADCESTYEKADYVIFGVPYDSTTSFQPGTRHGPRVIREYSWNFESYIPLCDIDLNELNIVDMGDLELFVLPDMVVDDVYATVSEIVTDRKIPVMLGGEHSITTGAVRAVRPDWFVVCDAHLDLREEYRGTKYNHACTTRRVYDSGFTNIIIIGARSGTENQFRFAEKNLHLFTADKVRELGIKELISSVKKLIGDDSVYLSIDADVIDCCLTPALGTPEPFGLTPLDISEVVRALAAHSVAFDYVEVCGFDNGQTAAVGAQIIREFIAAHSVGKNALKKN